MTDHLVAALDRDVPVGNLDRIAATLAYPSFRARLLGGFAALALFLAVAGLYGVLSQMVAQRTQEIGVRMALGAQRSAVLALVAKQGLLLSGAGLVAGLAIALWLGRFLRAMLYGIRPADPLTLVMVSLVLAAAALIATWLPARRAVRISIQSSRCDKTSRRSTRVPITARTATTSRQASLLNA